MPFNAKRLTDLRKKNNLSIYRLSIEANVEASQIARLESGEYKYPAFHIVERLADFFKVNMETFKCGRI